MACRGAQFRCHPDRRGKRCETPPLCHPDRGGGRSETPPLCHPDRGGGRSETPPLCHPDRGGGRSETPPLCHPDRGGERSETPPLCHPDRGGERSETPSGGIWVGANHLGPPPPRSFDSRLRRSLRMTWGGLAIARGVDPRPAEVLGSRLQEDVPPVPRLRRGESRRAR